MQTEEGTQLWQFGAGELAAAIRERQASCVEVVKAHLDRIEAVNPEVNALHVVLAEQALTSAKEADRRLAAGEPVGSLHGVPVSIKENIDVAGTASTWGVAAMAESVASVDAPLVEHLRRSGAIPISRGNLPDFALRWHTDNALMGATRNPWDPTRTPGGSSGGEAVALATGMAPLGVGNDSGGSLRWPSQCNGTVALRPTMGRVPDATVIPPIDSPLSLQLFNVQGPMARHVADLRIALREMSQPSPRDPGYVPAPLEGSSLDGPPMIDLAIPEGTEPEIAAGLRRAALALEKAGYVVNEEMPPGVEQAARLWVELLVDDVRRIWPAMEAVASVGANEFLQRVFAIVPELDRDGYATGWLDRRVLARSWAERQADRPLVLAPVCLRKPFHPAEDAESPESAQAVIDSMRMLVTVNLLGLPSAAVPVGRSEDGLPLGVQIIGPRFREDLCLDAAEAVEANLGTLTPIDPQRA